MTMEDKFNELFENLKKNSIEVKRSIRIKVAKAQAKEKRTHASLTNDNKGGTT